MKAAALTQAFRTNAKPWSGYAALALVASLFWLYVTFPYDALRRRVVSEAAANGWSVTVGSAGPGFFGVTLKDVRLTRPTNALPLPGVASEIRAAEPLLLSAISVRPSLFPLGVGFRAKAFGGSVRGAVGTTGALAVDLSFDNLDPSQGNLKGFSGVDLSGKVAGELSLSVPREEAGTLGAREYDWSRARGAVVLKGEKLLVRGGTLTVPVYGQLTPLNLPRIALGSLEGRAKIEKGLATLEEVHSRGDDLELLAGGTVKLNRRPDFSELNLDLKLKTQPEFVKRLGLLGAGFSMLTPDKADPSFRAAKVSGYLGRPDLGPAR